MRRRRGKNKRRRMIGISISRISHRKALRRTEYE